MCELKRAIFAVVSDLHCRLEKDSRDSFLTVGSLRHPSNRHPVQALLDLIDREGIQADALLVPGDLTNKACREGLAQGWEHSIEIGQRLNAPIVIPVVGNHDIDSHRVDPTHPVFHIVQNLRPGFPFTDAAANASFWANGFCLQRAGQAELIAINTVIDQTDAASAKRGAFNAERIALMETSLTGRFTTPLRGAIMHHHPILHSGTFMTDTDVIPTGDALLASLGRLGCRFVIHGHKHFSRLSSVNGMAIFASGSFSAMLYEFAGGVGNTFHLVSVQGTEPNDVRGLVRTWIFQFGQGWRRSSAEYTGFPYLAGFGRTVPLPTIVNQLRAIAAAEVGKTRFMEPEVLAAAPDTEYLTPTEREQVNETLGAELKLSDHDQGRLELWRPFRP